MPKPLNKGSHKGYEQELANQWIQLGAHRWAHRPSNAVCKDASRDVEIMDLFFKGVLRDIEITDLFSKDVWSDIDIMDLLLRMPGAILKLWISS